MNCACGQPATVLVRRRCSGCGKESQEECCRAHAGSPVHCGTCLRTWGDFTLCVVTGTEELASADETSAPKAGEKE